MFNTVFYSSAARVVEIFFSLYKEGRRQYQKELENFSANQYFTNAIKAMNLSMLKSFFL